MSVFRSSSQALQDLFALEVCGKTGRWLEIGANEPEFESNTALLEANGWTGVSIEIEKQYRKNWKRSWRNTKELYTANALTFDYSSLNERYFDYISLDIEPPEFTYAALVKLTNSGIRAKCITFEHEKYCFNDTYQTKAYSFLTTHGYIRVMADVQRIDMPEVVFEDWYVDPLLTDFLPKDFVQWARTTHSLYAQHEKNFCL